jgi:hypothetical protein
MVAATQSYRERMKAQRAEARAKRDAEKAEWHREPSCGTKLGSWRSMRPRPGSERGKISYRSSAGLTAVQLQAN